uniref:Uncharacterized protein n=1 Tax=Rhizophora mucronata TaxID=61149 RepID=A0A2P2N6W6_RHIMU
MRFSQGTFTVECSSRW